MTALELFEAAVRRIMSFARYYGTYEATVQGQNDDDTVAVLPDDPSIRGDGLDKVPIRHGLPGVTVRVATGARCLLGFDNGDPKRPYVSLWAAGSVEEIRFGSGALQVARVGDPVAVSLPPLSAIGTLNGSPFAATLAIGTQIMGSIAEGSPRLKAGS